MIRKPYNWNEVREFSDYPKLPLGAYVCRIKKVAIRDVGDSEQLCLLFDIIEGDYTGFFDKEFKANKNDDKKWKGVLRQWIFKDDGSEKDEFTKSSFKGMITSFEKSNPGFVFNWDENSLVGKVVGIMFRNEEWDYNGKHGWAVRPFKAISADSVRSGDFTLPKDKPLNKESYSADSYSGVDNYSNGAYNGFAEIPEEDELPF